jgi:AcrR family transcriptional regulator
MARRASNVTRARIQDVALALFHARAYDATSLQEIAACVGRKVHPDGLHWYATATG